MQYHGLDGIRLTFQPLLRRRLSSRLMLQVAGCRPSQVAAIPDQAKYLQVEWAALAVCSSAPDGRCSANPGILVPRCPVAMPWHAAKGSTGAVIADGGSGSRLAPANPTRKPSMTLQP